MRRFIAFIAIPAIFLACSKDEAIVPPSTTNSTSVGNSDTYSPSDMVLIYGGGSQRSPYTWDSDRMGDYVTYSEENGITHWLFDGFLFLEILDYGDEESTDVMFTSGYGYESATKDDWEALLDYWFQEDTGIGAVEQAVEDAVASLGEPPSKRQIVLCIPEPITTLDPDVSGSTSTYWGSLDGVELSFSSSEDRVAACEWFVDEAVERFEAMGYSQLELNAFYWLAEKATNSRTILEDISDYVHNLGYDFVWVPYYGADGYSEWYALGFDTAYLQPNYFFNSSLDSSRMDDACTLALTYSMGMEIEFDDDAMSTGGKASRLREYMETFKEYGIWDGYPLSYYQNNQSLRYLKYSSVSDDNELYHELCQFIVTRPTRIE